MILYPTETIYALGVDALVENQLQLLYRVKGGEKSKGVSWLVRDMADVERYGVVTQVAAKIAEQFLPGPLTLVLAARDTVPDFARGPAGTVSFRISSDSTAQQVVADFMNEHNAPLTCTSANKSGLPSLPTPAEILEQLGDEAECVTKIVDDGPRTGTGSTVVKVVDDEVTILRTGAIPTDAILSAI